MRPPLKGRCRWVFVAALNYRRGEACCEGRIVDEARISPAAAQSPCRGGQTAHEQRRRRLVEGGGETRKPLIRRKSDQLCAARTWASFVEVGAAPPITNAASLSVAAALRARA